MSGVFDNEVFPYFAFYATIVILKTMLMSVLTSIQRVKHKAFINLEDAKGMKEKGKDVELRSHPDVERYRRCHLNDLENVIPFVLIGLLYTATGPELTVALIHFRVFTAARIAHTFVYLLGVRQPARAGMFTIGVLATLSMAVNVYLNSKI